MKILLLEDQHYEIARSVFEAHGAQVVVTHDFREFENNISSFYDVACLDIFFPEETGKNLKDRGREALQKISSVIPGSEIPELGDYLIQIQGQKSFQKIALDQKEAWSYIEELADLVECLGPSIKQVIETMQMYAIWVWDEKMKLYQSDLARRLLIALCNRPELSVQERDRLKGGAEIYNVSRYRLLEKQVEEGPENAQPLGVIAAEMAIDNNLPFVLASDLGHHSESAQPICVYQRYQGWPEIIDPPGEAKEGKADPEYWENVFKILEKKVP